MDFLINAIESFWNALLAVFQTVFDYAKSGYGWICGLIVSFVLVITSFLHTAADFLSDLVSRITAIVVPDSNVVMAATDWLNTANTFFPVVEGFAILVVLSLAWLAATTYRFAKSWIPTVA